MNELECLQVKKSEIIIRSIVDAVLLFLILYVIAFIDEMIKDFKGSFSVAFGEKIYLFFIILAICIAIIITLVLLDERNRCKRIIFDKDKIIMVRKAKEEGFGFNSQTEISYYQLANNEYTFIFKRGKKNNYVFLSECNGKQLLDFFNENGINIINNDRKSN